jgi:glycosyltransferase involved in cell wall biosynthesis
MIEENEKHRLRICLIGPAFPYRGGISHYNTCLAIELMKRHDVSLINYSRLYPEFLFPGKTQLDESESALSVGSERIIDSLNPFTWVRAGFRVASIRPDLIIVQWWHPYFALALFKICQIARMMRRGRIVFICHNVVPHERSPIDKFLSRLAFFGAHGFLVQSGEDRDNLLRLRSGAGVRVHPHPIYDFFKRGGITKERAREQIGAREKHVILFFGYVRPYKGLRYLLEALPIIRESIPAELFVVGEFYEDQQPYRDLVEELGIIDSVRFVDRYIGNDEVEPFFVASDLVMLPYISATQSGIVQISLAFDRPVIVTGVGGLPEVVSPGKTGFIVPPADSQELAAAAVKFFEEGWGEKMAPFFEDERKRFSWTEMAETLEELYRELGKGDAG